MARVVLEKPFGVFVEFIEQTMLHCGTHAAVDVPLHRKASCGKVAMNGMGCEEVVIGDGDHDGAGFFFERDLVRVVSKDEKQGAFDLATK